MKNSKITDFLVNYITVSTVENATLSETGLTVSDLKREVSDRARSEERLNSADWVEWCRWFSLSDPDKTHVIIAARNLAAAI